jgi:hypothetical protein
MVLRTRIPALTYFGMKVLNIETWALAATIHKNRHVLRAWLPDGILTYQNANFGIFWRAVEWKMGVYFTAI